MRLVLAGCCVLLPVAVLAAAAAPPRIQKLVRTRQILQAVNNSFVGEPTRAELLTGGLTALGRIQPGSKTTVDRKGNVTFVAGKKTLVFDTDGMVSDTEVAADLEQAVAAITTKLPPAELDDVVGAGVVASLADRHSAYIRPYYMERLGYSEGEMLGDVGLEVTVSGNAFLIKSVQPGSTAQSGGVKPMQLLRKVDQQGLEGLSLGEVQALLLGPAGSTVEMLVEPRGGEKPSIYKLVRDPPFALQPHVKVLGDALYIVPGPILGASAKVVRDAITGHARPKRGVILDFRGNAGGQVGDAAALADLFIPGGALAQVVSRANRPVQRFEAQPGDPGEGLPVVVLVDGRSASAAELVALVLRERLRAPLYGVQTYGKGSVQKLIPIDGGGFLKVTSAMYMTPAGTTVGEGIVPDVALELEDCPRRGQEGALETDAWLKAAYDSLPGGPD
jgi:carboxyl-terminal processing protease